MTYVPTDADVEPVAMFTAGAYRPDYKGDKHCAEFWQALNQWEREEHRTLVKAILTAHHAELEWQGWQVVRWEPIETAPKDGLDVLIAGGTYFDSGSVVTDPIPASGVNVAGYRKCGAESHCWQGDASNSCDDHYWYEPTHWMPFPTAPKPSGVDK